MEMDGMIPLEGPSPSRRQFLNFLTGSLVAATAGSLLYPAGRFFLPPQEGEGDGAIAAKDKLGHIIPAEQILASAAGTRALVAGLAGEPTYLTVQENGVVHPWGIVNNCTHLGCTFPWNEMADQFQCPCHGSRYDAQGQVVRGPANRPLKLVQVTVRDHLIWLSPWQGNDPRTGAAPWWS